MAKMAAALIGWAWLGAFVGPVLAEEAAVPEEALRAIESGNWESAAAALAAPAKDPANEAANYWLGAAEVFRGQYKAAQSPLAAALQANPYCRPAAVLLTRCAAALCMDDRTPVSMADPAVKAFPVDAEIAHWVGRAWMSKYFFEKQYRRPGRETVETGQSPLQQAIAQFQWADILDAGSPENHRWLALALQRLGRHEEALAHARTAARLGPVGWEVFLIQGTSLTHLGRHEEALDAYDQAGRACPAMRKHVDFERGKALCAAGRFNEAVEAFTAVLQADKGYRFGRHWLGQAAVAAKDYPLALWAFGESRSLDGLIDDLYWAGRCAYDLGKDAQAEALFRQAIEEAGANKGTPSAEWVHYLGRAQWGQRKHDEALKNLEAAFTSSPGNLMFGRWLYRARLARDDLHGAIEVCRRLGGAGRYAEAVEGLEAILKKWPEPRMADALAGKRAAHPQLASDILGDLHYAQGRYFTAAYHYDKAWRMREGHEKLEAGWALLLSGQPAAAERVFRACAGRPAEATAEKGRFGLGCALLASGKAAEADAVFAKIEKTASLVAARDTGRLWAQVASGAADAGELADAYALLGLMWNRRLGADRGEEVQFIAPGSLLDAAQPKLQRKDVILRVGDSPLGTEQQFLEFRKGKIPDRAVDALVRRGDRLFRVTVDYPAAVARVGKPSGATPAKKEANP